VHIKLGVKEPDVFFRRGSAELLDHPREYMAERFKLRLERAQWGVTLAPDDHQRELRPPPGAALAVEGDGARLLAHMAGVGKVQIRGGPPHYSCGVLGL